MTEPADMTDHALRSDLAQVAELVPAGSRVLDLGCGRGTLLRHLVDVKNCTGTGVDSDPELLVQAIANGVPVIQLDLDNQLDEFAAATYDVVVLSKTLQAVRRPADVLDAIGRIGTRFIVSMPNFGYWRNRARVLSGHMPISRQLPYHWHDSPNLRYTTLADLEEFFDASGYVVEERISIDDQGAPVPRGHLAANLRASAAIYLLHRR